MNLFHHVKPRLLLSRPYPAGKTVFFTAAKPWQNLHRTFIPSSVHLNPLPLKKRKGHRVLKAWQIARKAKSSPPADDTQLHKFSDKLRLQLTDTRAAEMKKKREDHAETSNAETSNTVAAAEDAISRDHANQEDIIKTLHEAIVSDRRLKRKPMKKRPNERKKTEKVDSSALFEAFVSEKAPERTHTQLIEEGRKAHEWQDRSWGKDALAPSSTLELEPVPQMRRATPPHQQQPPVPYTRRIEGLLQHTVQPVLEGLAPPCEQKPIAKLAHGLDRVLFNPGVHWLQDPRSGVYNFTTWLESIPNVKNFAFDRVTGFVKSSSDEDLWTLAKRECRRYTGSTSSLTGMLSHLYFLISGFREVDTSSLSQHFQYNSKTFTAGQLMPVSVSMNYRDGIYAFDSASSDLADMNVLTWMGTMLEKFLTVPRDEFKRYLLDAPQLTEEENETRREAYRYSKSEQFVMRSQLDGIDSRLPGTGVFDIKTRAALPIRHDLMNYKENSGYLIKTLQGPVESFEREYYDLIRSAFLKYSFQVRIGNMDGVMVAYHNTQRLFGFQYIPLDEMDACLFGGKGRGDRVFQKCVHLLEQVADEIIEAFPKESLQCTFEADEDSCLHVWVEPSEWDTKKGPCPVVQFDVHVTNYLNEMEVRGCQAVSDIELPWVVHWSISRSSLDDLDVRYNLSAAKHRQFHGWNLPAGVGYGQMEEHWQSLKVSSTSKSLEYKSSYFRYPTKNVQRLRELAKSGREETNRLAMENAGKSKVVWGVPEDVEDSDVESREHMEVHMEDTMAISAADSPSTVIVENPAGSELEQALEGIALGSTAQETDLWSDDIEAALDGAEGSRDERLGLDAKVTRPSTKPGSKPKPSSSPKPEAVFESPPIVSKQGSQTRDGISESKDRALDEGTEKDNVAVPELRFHPVDRL